MEARFGHDFSKVRVHADGNAARSARSIGALAYTVGSDISFAASRYDPTSEPGRELLAHELAHVVQQRDSQPTIQLKEANNAGLAEIQGLPMHELLQRLSKLPKDVLADEEAGALVGGPRLVVAMRAARARMERDADFMANNRSQIELLPPDQGVAIFRFLAEPELGASKGDVKAGEGDAKASSPKAIADLPATEKLSLAVGYARRSRDKEWNDQLEALRSPQSIFGMVAVAGAFAGAQFIPITWIADAFAAAGIFIVSFFTGASAYAFMRDIVTFFKAINATSEAELKAAGEALARAVAAFGIALILSALTKGVTGGPKGGKTTTFDGAPPPGYVDGYAPGVGMVRVPEAMVPSGAPKVPPALQTQGGSRISANPRSVGAAKGQGSKWARLADLIEALGDEARMDRLEKIDPATEEGMAKLAELEREVERKLDLTQAAPAGQPSRGGESGLSERQTPGGPQPTRFERGNFAHKWLEQMRHELTIQSVPSRFESQFKAGNIISLDKMPDGLRAEVKIGETARADRVGRIIYEVKPNTEASIEAGLKRADEYARLANSQNFDGRSDWRGVVVIYDAKAAAKYIR